MSTDLKIDLFARDLFDALWRQHGLRTEPLKSKQPPTKSEFNENILRAVEARQAFFHSSYEEIFENSHQDFKGNSGYFFSAITERFPHYLRDDPSEYALMSMFLCSCAFVADMVMLCKSKGDDFLDVADKVWAMFVDLTLKEIFYEAGGWDALQIFAEADLAVYRYMRTFSDMVHCNRGKNVLMHKCHLTIGAMDSFLRFKDWPGVDDNDPMALKWVDFCVLQPVKRKFRPARCFKLPTPDVFEELESTILGIGVICNPFHPESGTPNVIIDRESLHPNFGHTSCSPTIPTGRFDAGLGKVEEYVFGSNAVKLRAADPEKIAFENPAYIFRLSADDYTSKIDGEEDKHSEPQTSIIEKGNREEKEKFGLEKISEYSSQDSRGRVIKHYEITIDTDNFGNTDGSLEETLKSSLTSYKSLLSSANENISDTPHKSLLSSANENVSDTPHKSPITSTNVNVSSITDGTLYKRNKESSGSGGGKGKRSTVKKNSPSYKAKEQKSKHLDNSLNLFLSLLQHDIDSLEQAESQLLSDDDELVKLPENSVKTNDDEKDLTLEKSLTVFEPVEENDRSRPHTVKESERSNRPISQDGSRTGVTGGENSPAKRTFGNPFILASGEKAEGLKINTNISLDWDTVNETTSADTTEENPFGFDGENAKKSKEGVDSNDPDREAMQTSQSESTTAESVLENPFGFSSEPQDEKKGKKKRHRKRPTRLEQRVKEEGKGVLDVMRLILVMGHQPAMAYFASTLQDAAEKQNSEDENGEE